MQSVDVYSTALCLNDSKQGTWCFTIIWNDGETQCWGNSPTTSLNEMDLTSLYYVLEELLKNKVSTVNIYIQNNFIMKGITEWIHKWRKNDFTSSNKNSIKNKELWKLIDEKQKEFESINWMYIKKTSKNHHFNRLDSINKNLVKSINN